jgi:hypothetical protein
MMMSKWLEKEESSISGWGILAKSAYHKLPLNSKMGRAFIQVLVKECTSRDVLTTETA